MSPRWGIYILANDVVAEQLRALLNSLEEFAPGLPVSVIPFDDRQRELSVLLGARGHGYHAPAALEDLTEAGRRFYPGTETLARLFRKLAVFDGPYERFLFLDADVVCLAPIRLLIDAVEGLERPHLVSFDLALDAVYRPGPFRDLMVAEYGAEGLNTGIFMGYRGAFAPGEIVSRLASIPEETVTGFLPYGEQAHVNYLVDTARIPRAEAWRLVPGFANSCWAALGRAAHDGSVYRLDAPDRWDHGRRLFFLHWAGCDPREPDAPNHDLFVRFRGRAAAS